MAVEIITTVLIPASAVLNTVDSDGTVDEDITVDAESRGPYDLTSLSTVRDELGLATADTSNDQFLSRAITQSSKAIARYCNRVFPVEAVQDVIYIQQDPYPWQVPGGVYPLQLSRWPLFNSAVVSFTGNTHSSTLVDGIGNTAGITQGTLVFASDGSVPVGTIISSVSANSVTLSQATTSSETDLSFNTGLQVVQTLGSGDLRTLVYGTDFTIDARRGWLIRLNAWTAVSEAWESEPVTVIYEGGYSDIPDDLEDACLRLVTARFRARGRDPMLMQRDQNGMVGTERYWVGTAPGQTGAFAPEIMSLIEPYRVPVIG